MTDDEVFGAPEAPKKSVDLSSLERAFEGVADGVRRQSVEEVKALVEKSVEKIGDIAKSIGAERAAVVDAVKRVALGAEGHAQALADVRKAISEAAPPDMSAIAESVNRIAEAVERSNVKMIESVSASNLRIAEAMEQLAAVERQVKVELPAARERPTEWRFQMERNAEGDVIEVVARAGAAPATALEAARRVLNGGNT